MSTCRDVRLSGLAESLLARSLTVVFFEQLGFASGLCVVVACALSIGIFGTLLTQTADQLADRTGLGEALAGAVLLGAVTSLPGVVVSVSAGFRGIPDMALGNAIGGIAVQTLFLAIADVCYPRANLEHAAASLPNMAQASLLIVLLSCMGLGAFLPEVTVLGAHPVSWLLVVVYGYGLRIVAQIRDDPMWSPKGTDETREDIPELAAQLPPASRLWIRFLPLAAILATTGWILEGAMGRVVQESALTSSTAGLLVTSTVTSLPELVTSIAAVRQGSLTMAVGGIVGGNTFDTLFAASADFAYQDGSLYHRASDDVSGWILISILMMAILVMGLIRREKYGVAKIGIEGTAIIVCYVAGVVVLAH